MSVGATERSQLSALPCWRRAAAEPVPLATSPRKAHSAQCPLPWLIVENHSTPQCSFHSVTVAMMEVCCRRPLSLVYPQRQTYLKGSPAAGTTKGCFAPSHVYVDALAMRRLKCACPVVFRLSDDPCLHPQDKDIRKKPYYCDRLCCSEGGQLPGVQGVEPVPLPSIALARYAPHSYCRAAFNRFSSSLWATR